MVVNNKILKLIPKLTASPLYLAILSLAKDAPAILTRPDELNKALKEFDESDIRDGIDHLLRQKLLEYLNGHIFLAPDGESAVDWLIDLDSVYSDDEEYENEED